jgi:hypothetical protein
MSTMRILLLVLALAAVGFAARYALTGSSLGDGGGHSPPARQLDGVRDRAKELEGELQRAADKVDEAAGDAGDAKQ